MFKNNEIDFNIEVEEDKQNKLKYPSMDNYESQIYNNFVGGINDKCHKCLKSLSGKKRNSDYFILFDNLLWCKKCANNKTKQHSFIEKLNTHKSTNTSKASSRNLSRINSDDEFNTPKMGKKLKTSVHLDNEKILVRKRSYSLNEFTDFQKNVIKKINTEDSSKKINKEQNLKSSEQETKKTRSKTENGSEIKKTRSSKFKMFFFRRS